MNYPEKTNQIYRCHDILDERVLSVIKKVKREYFLPQKYKSFSVTDIAVPLDSYQKMLVPSCEAKIIQAMEFHSNDNVLVIGTGSGYLVECISYLSNTVSAYEIDPVLFEFGKRNLDLYSQNRHKIFLNQNNIMDCLDKIIMYKKILFTCSIDSYLPFIEYLDTDAKCFFFINQYKSPYKKGIIIDKTRNGYTVIENIVTSQTNKITD